MASNRFGNIFSITTWGESHGKAVGVVIDGCPAGLCLSEEDINREMQRRAPGQSPYTTPRKESDTVEILSGLCEGVTTGAPIMISIKNGDADPSKYDCTKDLYRPGHANYTYLEKYGTFDHRGGGRASARETAARVAAGAVAKKLLAVYGITFFAYILQVGNIKAVVPSSNISGLKEVDPLFCPDCDASKEMQNLILETKANGDSLGGVVEFQSIGVPVGLGDPVYEKLEANLAKAMMSIPASKGFEMGSGFEAVTMLGSEHNDEFVRDNDGITTKTNYAGGVLGGISTGLPLIGRVAFKPTSSIMKPQNTVDIKGDQAKFLLPKGSRHDPCVAIRAVPVVEAMGALVLVDSLLASNLAKVESHRNESTAKLR
ncbi:MAG: chorismate synthase [Chlamydiota bacterium]|nr:chorismate synthase [Chlamydiota bacterium]